MDGRVVGLGRPFRAVGMFWDDATRGVAPGCDGTPRWGFRGMEGGVVCGGRGVGLPRPFRAVGMFWGAITRGVAPGFVAAPRWGFRGLRGGVVCGGRDGAIAPALQGVALAPPPEQANLFELAES